MGGKGVAKGGEVGGGVEGVSICGAAGKPVPGASKRSLGFGMLGG